MDQLLRQDQKLAHLVADVEEESLSALDRAGVELEDEHAPIRIRQLVQNMRGLKLQLQAPDESPMYSSA